MSSVPDRSGEPALRALMQATATWKDRHIVIQRSFREDANRPMLSDDPWEAWIGSKNAYRFEAYGMWGDGRIVVSDGTTLVSDALDDSVPVQLRDAKGSRFQVDGVFDADGSNGSPIWLLFQGESALAKLVSKDSEITATKGTSGFAHIRFSSASFGYVDISYLDGRIPELVGCEFDNKPFLTRMYEQNPEDWSPPGAGPLTRHWVVSQPMNASTALFSTSVAKGRKVEDLRKHRSPLVDSAESSGL